MDTAAAGVTLAALAANGLLTGVSLDKVIVQLPARRRIGAVAYAAYARSADLGHGIVYYAVVGVGAAALTVAAFATAASLGSSAVVTGLLAAAAALSVLHSIATGRAAPVMFKIGQGGDTQTALDPLLARFARWSAVRAALQAATLVTVAIAVGIGVAA